MVLLRDSHRCFEENERDAIILAGTRGCGGPNLLTQGYFRFAHFTVVPSHPSNVRTGSGSDWVRVADEKSPVATAPGSDATVVNGHGTRVRRHPRSLYSYLSNLTQSISAEPASLNLAGRLKKNPTLAPIQRPSRALNGSPTVVKVFPSAL